MTSIYKIMGLVLILCLVLFKTATLTQAHPLDEIGNIKVYDQKQILTLDREQIELKIETKFFAYEKTLVWETIDVNKDRRISAEEKNNWMQLGKNSSWIILADNQYFFEPREIIIADYFDFFSPPPALITIIYTLNLGLPSEGILQYYYQGRDKNLNEIQLEVLGKNNFSPHSSQKKPPDHIEIKFGKSDTFTKNYVKVESSDKLRAFLDKYLKNEADIPFGLKFWALLIAFSIGALHALTPGHGKAITAGFLIGEKGTIWHALNLGAIITLTHTASVFLLGLGALLLTQYIVPDTIIKLLNFISGLFVLIFGLYLVYTRSKKIFNSNLHFPASKTIFHSQSTDFHNHSNLSHKHLLPLGIAGGIVPCVDALAILVVAVSLNKIFFGLILLISFSLGLAVILIAGGIFVVIAKNKASKYFKRLSHLEPYINLGSAIIVSILGLLLLLNVE